MYSTCLYCNQSLGTNEVLETFPVGRRLAFDQARGRLWVVCRKCEKWNLSPFEERWEAMEDCERRFRNARKRVSSDNIGLARLDEGLELVRIGEPQRPEFAAWRYGDQFGRRRRRAILIGTGIGVVAGGVFVAGAATGILSGGGYGVWQMVNGVVHATKQRRVAARVPLPSGERLTVRGADLQKATLIPPLGDGAGWGIAVKDQRLFGEHARHATALLMARVNSGGGSRADVQTAVRKLELARDPVHFIERLAQMPPDASRLSRWKERTLPKLDVQTRLALEMAVNEDAERAALEGELALLELEWKEAEEIAGIADRLGLPEDIDARLERLRRGETVPLRRLW